MTSHQPENPMRPNPDRGLYGISVAAELTGCAPETLRLYERKELLTPARTDGGTRRYSDDDITRIRRIAEVGELGGKRNGIKRILDLETENTTLRGRLNQG
jgi:MerR family transcriptional regulator/heat shock protein HspR